MTRNAVLWIAAAALLHAGQLQAENSDSEAEEIDEVTVIGARPLADLRREITLAEDRMYAIFNELNTDDGYDIICKKETRIGSQIPKRVCLARMYRERRSEAAMDETEVFVEGRMPAARRHQRILVGKMRALAEQHPELLKAVQRRQLRIQEFEAERERRFKD